MRKVYAVGESLVDIISKDNEIIAKKAGGSMLNTSVSLAKLGVNTSLISELGVDEAGDLICSFLKSLELNTSYIYRFTDGKTATAIATLDENNEAKYTFNKQYPQHRLMISLPQFTNKDILLFGSIYSIDNEISPVLSQIISAAKKRFSLIFYDPNIRKSNLKIGDENKIIENMKSADIIRTSDEDIKNVFGVSNFEDSCLKIPDLNKKTFIYTCGKKEVYIHTPSFRAFYDVSDIDVISTIGAGDSFNAGLIYAFIVNGLNKRSILEIDEIRWKKMIKYAIGFASNVCLSYDNYISDEFAKDMKLSV